MIPFQFSVHRLDDAPGLMDGVQDGGAAMHAFMEAIDPATAAARRRQIENQLLAYCHLDTLAMVRLWEFFSGRPT